MTDGGDQSETIAFLSCPAAYGASDPVQRIDTHVAIVFLAGDRAWKLKRAVRLPYLDFSTAERRRQVCEAELALNRRTAPDIYLAVRRVGRLADGQLAIDAGDAVDWLVEMRRFESGCLLDAMARRGPLESSLIRDLADRIASFHDNAEIVPGPAAGRLRAVIEGNRAAMAALDGNALRAADCDQLHDHAMALHANLASMLDRRGKEGDVRHCHGDLHLANICLWQGRPTLFDCLEFDTALATTDVLYDLAFLLMDLWQRGLHAEAALLFNRYCDMRGGAGEGLAAMPLFLSLRAAVRAHVNASAAERQADAVAGEAMRHEARRYLQAALAFLEPPPPRLVAIGGLSGTGKSTLAGRLAPAIGAPPGARWLRSDVLRKRMAGVLPEQALPPASYTHDQARLVYARLAREAEQALKAGSGVVVDAVFADPAERRAMAAIADAAGARFDGIWLDAPATVLRARVQARSGDASDADAAVVDRQMDYAVGDLSGWHHINAGGSADDVLERARALLAGEGTARP